MHLRRRDGNRKESVALYASTIALTARASFSR
jgi:hypothetical protein